MSSIRITRWLILALATAGLPCVAASQERGDDPSAAMKWFYGQRAFPGTTIPTGARRAAELQLESRWPQVRASRNALPSATAFSSAATWSPLGPAPIQGSTAGTTVSGRINAIAVDPTNSSVIYVGAATGGVWKTTNKGTSWTAMTDGQCGLAMGAIAIDPVNTSIVYAGTGEENFSIDSYEGCGILRSSDGGATWTQLGASVFAAGGGASGTIAKILIDPGTAGSTTGTTLYVASSLGLFTSSDGGTTWTKRLSGTFTDLVADPTDPNTLYAGQYGNGVYKTSNKGSVWTKVAATPTDGGRVSLAIAPSSPSVVYLAIAAQSTGAFLGLYRSVDAGQTWPGVSSASEDCKKQCWYDMSIAVSPTSPAKVYFSGFQVQESTDSGATFHVISSAIHVDQHTLVFDPQSSSTIYVGCDGGIFTTTDDGVTWGTLNTNLAISQFYPGISVSTTNANAVIGGTQDNGTTEWSGSSGWPSVQGGDGEYTAYDPISGQTYLTFTSGSNTLGPQRREKNSTSFFYKNSGINTADRSEWVLPLVMDPGNPKVLYYGTYRLYRTANSGDSWTSISSDLTRLGSGGLNTIAVAPSDSNTIYVGSADGNVEVTTNLGTTWTATTGLPTAAITRITVDPLDARTAWVTLSGYGHGHVYKTTTGGSSWTNVSLDLPDMPVNAIVRQRGSHEIDIGTDIGVFSLVDGATSWTPLAAGMPNTVVSDLVYDGPRGRLIAATHGRGMFSLSVTTAVLRGNATGSGTLSAADAQAILASVVGLAMPAGAKRYPNGDANCDGDVTAADALLVLSKVVGLNTGSACVGTIQ